LIRFLRYSSIQPLHFSPVALLSGAAPQLA
jgi:hypothetical protein